VLSTEAPWIHREGVLAHQASATDLLFITLRKSEALFSPSTRYRDLALGGDPLAAGAGDPGGGVVTRLLCCTPAVAWHSSGVGGLRGGDARQFASD
jgi:hypothetical protein